MIDIKYQFGGLSLLKVVSIEIYIVNDERIYWSVFAPIEISIQQLRFVASLSFVWENDFQNAGLYLR